MFVSNGRPIVLVVVVYVVPSVPALEFVLLCEFFVITDRS